MLPSNFNLSLITDPGPLAIAKTLMTFGCYIMDTAPTGFAFAAELPIQGLSPWPCIMAGKTLAAVGAPQTYHEYSWYGNTIQLYAPGCQEYDTAQLQTILSSLQAVASVTSWEDGNGNPFTPTPFANMNLLGMRGPYTTVSGTLSGYYDTAQFAYAVPNGSAAFVIQTVRLQPCTTSAEGPWYNWGDQSGWYVAPTLGRSYTLTGYGSGNLQARLLVQNLANSTTYYDSGWMSVGQSTTFNWPNQSSTSTVLQIKNPPNGGGAIRLELVGN